MTTQAQIDPPAERTCLAAGLFARLADCIDRGLPVEAIEAHRHLADLGFDVKFRRPRKGRGAAPVGKAVPA